MEKRQKWMLVAMATTAVAAPLAERAVAAVWTRAAGEEPPTDPTAPKVNWNRAIIWAVTAAVTVALVDLAARSGAAIAWERVTGSPPPAPKRRKRKRSRGLLARF